MKKRRSEETAHNTRVIKKGTRHKCDKKSRRGETYWQNRQKTTFNLFTKVFALQMYSLVNTQVLQLITENKKGS